MVSLALVARDDVLDAAYDWLCQQRRDWPADSDVWSFRRSWAAEKGRITSDLLAGRYRIDLLTRITRSSGEEVDLWSARDAVVLKAMAIVLAIHLPVSARCTHVKSHGGAKEAVRQVMRHLPANAFVLRTDVKAFYASIDHVLLLDRLARHLQDRDVLNLLGQYLRRTAERGGVFFDHERGISLGCPLSPLMGAFFLAELDRRMERSGLFYVRFMDDILVLSPTRWKLRRAVRLVNQVLGALRLEKHPDKTFVGRTKKGFDFLGYHFDPAGLSVAGPTIGRFVARATRLYEQEPGEPRSSSRLGSYVRRWVAWTRAGLHERGHYGGKLRLHSSSVTLNPSSTRCCA
jgi:RNA-directed DNA polymerase